MPAPHDVYYNLNRGGYSVLDRRTGLVTAYGATVTMTDVRFVVRAGGRRTTRANRSKLVHAYVRGTVVAIDGPAVDTSGLTAVSYNPYRGTDAERGSFYEVVSGDDIDAADAVHLAHKRVYLTA